VRAALLATPLLLALWACAGSEAPDLSGGDPGAGDLPADVRPDAPDVPADARPDAPPEAGPDLPADAPDVAPDEAPADPGPSDLPGADIAWPPSTALLDRTPDPRFDCAVSRTTTDAAPRAWAPYPALVATAGGTVFLARSESQSADPWSPAPRSLLVSPFDAAGTFGTPVTIPADADNVRGADAVPAGNGFLLAWADTALHTALRDASGAAVADPRTLAGAAPDPLTHPSLARRGDAFALAWGEPVGQEGRKVRLARLDASGAMEGTPLDFATPNGGWDDPAPRVAAGADRVGLLWRQADGNRGSAWFAAMALDGTTAVPPTRVSTVDEDGVTLGGSGWGTARVALMAAGSGWLAAWNESRMGADYMSGASSIIRVARLDVDGRSLHEAALRDVVVDRDEVEPILLPYRGAAALLWSAGTHIYICGGCYPDNVLNLVLLDPSALVPVSGVASLPNAPGGLMGATVAASGDDLLAAFAIRYHVTENAGTGTYACTAR
jgi:hypothetical protein